ncbi:hypothetical protein ACFE04_008988 [Oxalis oulophora]
MRSTYTTFIVILTVLFLVLAPSYQLSQNSYFNVVDYGAVGDSYTDDSQAFMNAWTATCNSKSQISTMYIPQGRTYLIHPMTFEGHCKSNKTTFQIDGDLVAPNDPNEWKCNSRGCKQWLEFTNFDGLTLTGIGTINGKGNNWWSLCKSQHRPSICHKKPTGIIIRNSNDVAMSNLTLRDSPQMHMAIERSTWVTITNINIVAPGDSPNTDGIHIQHSSNVRIDQSQIGTGDDCVSIGDGSSQLLITNMVCGPGHGISIGSLGKDGKYETVEHVHVRNATFTGTKNGVRIKTWQGGRGYVNHIIFEHIRSYHSSNPIIIDQYYCDHRHCTNETSSVRISDVLFSDIRGTSAKQEAVELECSESTPCTEINMKDINLRSVENGDKTESSCSHVNAESKSTNDKSGDRVISVSSTTTTSNTESTISTPKFSEELKITLYLREFTFNDLKSATRNFRPESLLGEGGFGCVFKGWIEENGTAPVKPGTGLTVAVKTLNHDGLQGSLPLPWSIRMKIALGAAQGLAFLHEEAPKAVIYRDFKTSNILLDADYNAKLSDFGLAKDGPEGDKSHVSTRVMGTYGYAAPEYVMTGHLTSKSDVYSFGVVLLEMMTGQRSMDKNRPNGEHNLVQYVRPHLGDKKRLFQLIDPRLEGHFSIKGALKSAQLAAQCLSRDPKARPKMSEVVEHLKPLPNLKDMASSSNFFQSILAERNKQNVNNKNGIRTHGGGFITRNGQHTRSHTTLNGQRASPCLHPVQSPKPNVR